LEADRLNRWLTLVANVAVVAGIVFLAFELRQNNELLEAQARATFTANRLTHIDRILAPENSALIVKSGSGEALTDDERFRYERLKHAIFVSWESAFREYQEGLADDLPIEGMRRSFDAYAGLLDTWIDRRDIYNEEFVSFVENQVIGDLLE
jgi:hypothetical protein